MNVFVASSNIEPNPKWFERHLAISQKGLSFTSEKEWNITIPLRGGSSNNNSLFAHVIFTKAGQPILQHNRYNPEMVYALAEVTRYLPFQEVC